MRNTTHISDTIKQLLLDYLSGELSDTNQLLLNSWIQEDPRNYNLFHEISTIWQAASLLKRDPVYDADKAWQEVLVVINRNEKKRRPLFIRLAPYFRIAAVAILIFSLGIGGGVYLKQSESLSDAWIEMNTPDNSKACITLPDNTQIWINTASVVRYSKNYGITNRSIQLKGEAYFKVAKNKELPFIVQTENVSVTALGTSFNVRSYPYDKVIETTLEEGSVMLMAQASDGQVAVPVTLVPDQMASYQKDKNSFTVEDTKAVNCTVWKENRWIIRNEPLGNFLKMLENRYNVKIHFQEEALKQHSFNGTIVNETLQEILEMVQLTAPIEFRINGKEVNIQMNNRQREKFSKVIQ